MVRKRSCPAVSQILRRPRETWAGYGENRGLMELYPLVMTNIAMENPLEMEVYSWENHLLLWAIFHGYVK